MSSLVRAMNRQEPAQVEQTWDDRIGAMAAKFLSQLPVAKQIRILADLARIHRTVGPCHPPATESVSSSSGSVGGAASVGAIAAMMCGYKHLTPPPHLDGRVTRVSIEGGKIVQVFDSSHHRALPQPPFHSAAYIYHRGGVLRFGKLTMNDADLEIVGDRPGVFDFFQREYLKQLVAGYSKTTAAKGLVAHMADYSRVRPHASPVSRNRQSRDIAELDR
jgi:hypothetical protein